MGEDWWNFDAHNKNCIDFFEDIVGRNINVKSYSGETCKEVKRTRESFHHLKEYYITMDQMLIER